MIYTTHGPVEPCKVCGTSDFLFLEVNESLLDGAVCAWVECRNPHVNGSDHVVQPLWSKTTGHAINAWNEANKA